MSEGRPDRRANALRQMTKGDRGAAAYRVIEAIAAREERTKIAVIRRALACYCEVNHADLAGLVSDRPALPGDYTLEDLAEAVDDAAQLADERLLLPAEIKAGENTSTSRVARMASAYLRALDAGKM